MYSINVFLTFSLSKFGMARFWIQHRKEHSKDWYRHLPVHLTGLTLCVTILVVTVLREVRRGGLAHARHHQACSSGSASRSSATTQARRPRHPAPRRRARRPAAADRLARPSEAYRETGRERALIDRRHPVAILFVGGYGGLGRHALLTLLRMFPGHFKGVVFCSSRSSTPASSRASPRCTSSRSARRRQLDKYVRFASSARPPRGERVRRPGSRSRSRRRSWPPS